MGMTIDELQKYINALRKCAKEHDNDTTYTGHIIVSDLCRDTANLLETVEAIPKDNVYKAIQEMMKYEHDGFVNISLARLDEILKKCGVSENGND